MTTIKNFTLPLSDLKFVHHGLARPESILAEKNGRLWCSDNRGSVTRSDPDGSMQTIGSIGGETNGLAMGKDGSIYIAHIGNGNIYKMDQQGNHEIILSEIDGHPLGSANYVFVDSRDRLWISVSSREIPWFIAAASPRPDGYIILWDDKGPRVVADGLYFANEIRLNADESYLYAAETMMARIVRYKVNDDGSLGPQEIVAPGHLGEGRYVDGFAFDAEGNIWVTSVTTNGLGIITPDGDFHMVFEDPNPAAITSAVAKVTSNSLMPEDLFACVGPTIQFPVSIAFADPDLQTVYIGSLAMPYLLKFRSPVPGLPMRHW